MTSPIPLASNGVEISSSGMQIAIVVGAIAIAALLFAIVLRRQVLAFEQGTKGMQEVAGAVQEGASAYLSRQLRTLVLFVVVVFGLLFLLSGDGALKTGREIFFFICAGFCAVIGYLGMWLDLRAMLCVADEVI